MDSLISVIIPIYQAEHFLKRCLESVVNQTYKNIEIICVVDGATDGSLEICKEFSEKDNRIIVKYQNNAGQSTARNRAMDIASGDYFAFVDSDDFVEVDMIEKLYSAVKASNCDMAFCDIYKYYSETNKVIESYYDSNVILDHEKLMEDGVADKIPGYPCNKLIKRNCLENIRFVVGVKYEDLEWVPRLFHNIKSAVYVNMPLYNYCYNPQSTCNNTSRQIINSYYIAEAFYRRYDYVKEYYPQYLGAAKRLFYSSAISLCAAKYSNDGEELPSKSKIILQELKKVSTFEIISDSGYRLKTKINLIAYRYFRPVYIIEKKIVFKLKKRKCQ